jgi:hypothetical protein
MALEVKRKAELSLVAILSGALPDLSFYPAKGGDDDGGTSLPSPPFGAIWIQDAEKTMPNEKTYLLNGTVVWVSRMVQAGLDVTDHSESVRQIYDVLLNTEPGNDTAHSLMIHGIDIVTVNEFTDDERHAYGDTISFVMGVSETD